MSRTSLDDLASRHPESRNALKALSRWFRTHSDKIIYPAKIARELPRIDAYEVASTLILLVRAGYLIQKYKVIAPSGAYTDEEFDDVRRIPERLPDRFNNYFDTAEADVTPVFHRRDI